MRAGEAERCARELEAEGKSVVLRWKVEVLGEKEEAGEGRDSGQGRRHDPYITEREKDGV